MPKRNKKPKVVEQVGVVAQSNENTNNEDTTNVDITNEEEMQQYIKTQIDRGLKTAVEKLHFESYVCDRVGHCPCCHHWTRGKRKFIRPPNVPRGYSGGGGGYSGVGNGGGKRRCNL